LRYGELIGIVSRGNLLQALAGNRNDASEAASITDRTVRHDVLAALRDKTSHGSTNVIVSDGVVELWGWVETEAARRAVLVAAREIAGV
ncbi:MAG: BON domain-containing protein, partial [Alphaproteobacteria bacterium]